MTRLRPHALTLVVSLVVLTLPCASDGGDVIVLDGPSGSIQAAIDDAEDGDEFVLPPGLYTENIHFRGKNIVLRSEDPTIPAVVAATRIYGTGPGSVVTFSGEETSACQLAGLTIAEGTASGYGGGIRGNGTQAAIRYNTIAENSVELTRDGLAAFGGGLYACDGIIEYNTIHDNSAEIGGGGLYQCRGVIQFNTIVRNSARVYGGGLALCDGNIQNNFVLLNQSLNAGGGLAVCDGAVRFNTVYGNWTQGQAGGLWSCQGIIENNIIWANVANESAQLYDCSEPSYCCIQGWPRGQSGNIFDDPLFANVEGGDFHLTVDSPCIDAAEHDPEIELDIDEDPRGFDGNLSSPGNGREPDIGADEFVVRYALFIETMGDGTVSPSSGIAHLYLRGDTANVAAFPADKWDFTQWSGHLGGNQNPTEILIDNNKFVTAIFEKTQYAWTTEVSGQGRVDPQDGQAAVDTIVTLSAIPDDSWCFDHWEGDVEGGDNPIDFPLEENTHAVAVFVKEDCHLAIEVNGEGQVLPGPGAYSADEEIQLTAQPDPGWVFDRWDGELAGQGPRATLLMDEDKSVTVHFAEREDGRDDPGDDTGGTSDTGSMQCSAALAGGFSSGGGGGGYLAGMLAVAALFAHIAGDQRKQRLRIG